MCVCFFFKQKTAYEMRISDWSSDVCSSDLVMNALSALAACRAVGVDVAAVIPALARFRSVKRRLELLGDARGVTVYDDFAHHPTAIATTLRSEEHTSELQSLMRISYAVFCLKKKKQNDTTRTLQYQI